MLRIVIAGAHDRTALLVIDMQIGVLPGCWDAAGVVQRTARVVERARISGVSVVWVQDEDDFARGSAEWNLAPPLTVEPGERRVFKLRRDAFVGTDLAQRLEADEVRHLVIAGAETDRCIQITSERAAAAGYDVTLVEDCHTTRDLVAGETLLSGRQIVAHSNAVFATLRYPGQRIAVTTHDDPHLLTAEGGPLDSGRPRIR